MTQPIWNTPAGSIGTYSEGVPVTFNFSASPSTNSNIVYYTKLNGDFPKTDDINNPFQFSYTGQLTGTAAEVAVNTSSEFTLRVYEFNGTTYSYEGFTDRTFSITISGTDSPSFITPSGELYPAQLLDCTWSPFQLQFSNPDPDTTAVISIISGTLPPGLEIDAAGLITGYASPPVDADDNPIIKTYTFTLRVASESGHSDREFSITVKNQELLPSFIGRPPALLNNRPLSANITIEDPYYAYYFTGNSIGTFLKDNEFIFKFIGYNFDTGNDEDLTYVITGITTVPTVTYNSTNGWASGTLVDTDPSDPNNIYNFTVQVIKTSNPSLTSSTFSFSMTVNGNISSKIAWIGTNNLGIIDNGSISDKFVLAKSQADLELEYTVVSGSLPVGLTLLDTGEISGRVAFESKNFVQSKNLTYVYNFTVQATSKLYSYINSTRTYSITTVQKQTVPYDNIYMRALLPTNQREEIKNLVNNRDIIPEEAIYRPTDPYFGVKEELVYEHMFGIPSVLTDYYIQAIQINHYWRDITLGPLKTAVARDEFGEILYEVVYGEVIDKLINNDGISISKQINWPKLINDDIFTLYPASLPNMRTQIQESIGYINDSRLLPKWMRSQQIDRNIMGYVPSYVLCYLKPGWAAEVLKRINTNWPHKFNEYQFTLDRYEIDRSLTFQYNSETEIWQTLPSSVVSDDSENKIVLYPRKTILPYSLFSDPYYNYVGLLLHLDGANNSQMFTDNSPNPKTLTAVGNPRIKTNNKKFGTASLNLNGGTNYITVPPSIDLTFGVENFTIECWVYQMTSDDYTLITWSSDKWKIYYDDNKLKVSDGAGDIIVGGSVSTENWNFIALTRNSGNLRLFINGIQTGQKVRNTTSLSGDITYIGSDSLGSTVNGYIDEFRITKGIARYTINFAVPKKPFSDS